MSRFTHPVSQVGAGIVLACYMQGICACKYFFFVEQSFIQIVINLYIK